MILRYNEFLNEAKKAKGLSIDLLVKLFKDKPVVKLNSKSFPDQKDIYSTAGIKKYFNENGFTSTDADDAIYSISNAPYKSKYKVDHVNVRNHHFDENYPHMYMDMTEEEVKKAKDDLEKKSADMSKPMKSKREEAIKAAAAEKKKSTEDRKTPKRPRPKKAKK